MITARRLVLVIIPLIAGAAGSSADGSAARTNSTRLAALGAAHPSGVTAGGATVFTVSISGASALSEVAVTADLTAIGGSVSQAFRDDGLEGDVAAADGVFTYMAIVQSYVEPGVKMMSVRVSDASGTTPSQVAVNVHTPFDAPAPATSASATALGVIDFDADGRGDLFRYDPVSGRWTQELAYDEGGFASFAGVWSPGWTVVAGEFNGDTRTDLFLYDEQTGVWFKAISAGPGSFTYVPGTWSPGWSIYSLHLNADGLSDVFVYNRASGLWLKCLSVASGGFDYAGGAWSPGWSVFAAELDGDGLTDLFLYNDVTGLWFRALHDGGLDFRYVGGAWSPGWNVFPDDFTGDRLSDLLLYNPPTGQFFLVTNTGVDFSYINGVWGTSLVARTGDFDGDGRADVFTYNPGTGQWTEAVSNGATGFTYFSGTWLAGGELQVSDFNADRKQDLLLYHRPSGVAMQAIHTGLGTGLDAFSYTSHRWEPGAEVASTQPKPVAGGSDAPVPVPPPPPTGVTCVSSSPEAIVECQRARFPGFMSHTTMLTFIRGVASDLNLNGIAGGPYGILRKAGGTNCGGYSCDIICAGNGSSQRQYDVLGDADGAQIPGWDGPLGTIRVDVCEVQ